MRSALVVGRAACVMEDYAAARALGEYDEVLVVGKMLEAFPDAVGHAVSFHSNLLVRWAGTRASRGLPPAGCYWGATHRGKPMYAGQPAPEPLRRVEQCGGSSGFMAVQIARGPLGCERVVLAGMPMTGEGGHYAGALQPVEAPGQRWPEADRYWETWVARQDWLRPAVRSFSGRTRSLLGMPTEEWLRGDQDKG